MGQQGEQKLSSGAQGVSDGGNCDSFRGLLEQASHDLGCSVYGVWREVKAILLHHQAFPDQLAQLGWLYLLGLRWAERRLLQPLDSRMVLKELTCRGGAAEPGAAGF